MDFAQETFLMQSFNPDLLKQLYIPAHDSHKGQNGKLLIIGGSRLFHAASLWALTTASRIVDMVFYASVAENNAVVQELKKEFRNGIVVARDDIESYIEEAEAVLIGPGMLRQEESFDKNKHLTLKQINEISNEGEQTYYLTRYLLTKYPHKKWVIDAGALQMIDLTWLKHMAGNVVLTPHVDEFSRVFGEIKDVGALAKEYKCTILLKGENDVVCSSTQCVKIAGGNPGMTKGGTGDVLAGLIAALATKNELFLAASAGSYINKQAGESLEKRVGYYFNASDLANEIPQVMKRTMLDK